MSTFLACFQEYWRHKLEMATSELHHYKHFRAGSRKLWLPCKRSCWFFRSLFLWEVEHCSVDPRCWRRALSLIHWNRFKLISRPPIHFLPKVGCELCNKECHIPQVESPLPAPRIMRSPYRNTFTYPTQKKSFLKLYELFSSSHLYFILYISITLRCQIFLARQFSRTAFKRH